MSRSAFCIGVIAASQRKWRGHQAPRLTKRLVSLIQWSILEFNGDADALDRFIACAQRQLLARANSVAEWCSEPLWKIRLQGRCCRLDHCPFPADEAC